MEWPDRKCCAVASQKNGDLSFNYVTKSGHKRLLYPSVNQPFTRSPAAFMDTYQRADSLTYQAQRKG